ncbi:MAG: hypothetical protein PHU23_19355 [Dehalococcoidales bacterium]|nr:hypothetical protein [Dehalococcoidales bacterium]
MDDLNKSLLPTEDDVRKILAQVMQAQRNQLDIQKSPLVILQDWVGSILLNMFDSLQNMLHESAEQFDKEVNKSINDFRNALEQAIKRIMDKHSR